jgi:hypothetical protein
MCKEILVPLDGSKLAESILPYVRCLGEALKVPVHLLHVKDPKIKASFSQPLQEEDYLKNVASSILAFIDGSVYLLKKDTECFESLRLSMI